MPLGKSRVLQAGTCESGSPSPEVITARLEALKTLQPGDIVISEYVPGTLYLGMVTRVIVDEIIDLAFQARLVDGKLMGMEVATSTHANNAANSYGLRILRATDGMVDPLSSTQASPLGGGD